MNYFSEEKTSNDMETIFVKKALSIREKVKTSFNDILLFSTFFIKDDDNAKKSNKSTKITKDGMTLLMSLGLIKEKGRICKNCNEKHSLIKCSNLRDGYIWKCSKCKKSTESLRADSIFHNSRLSLHQILVIMFMFCINSKQKDICNMADVSDKTVTCWINYCRNLCTRALQKINYKLGGNGKYRVLNLLSN